MSDPKPIYRIVGGKATRVDPEQAREYAVSEGDPGFATEKEAVAALQKEHDYNLAEEAGGASRIAAGIMPGVARAGLIKGFEASGDDMGAQYLRHLLRGASEHTDYKVADFAGLLAMSEASAGLGAVGRVGGLLPEAGSIMGSAIRTGGRLGAEGALMGLSSATEDAALENKSLMSEAVLADMARRGGAGFLMGGALGAPLGAGGALLKKAVPAIGDAIGKSVTLDSAESGMLHELGATNGQIARLAAEEGGAGAFLNEAERQAQEAGIKLSDNPAKLRQLAESNVEKFAEQRMAVAKEFDSAATGTGPSWRSFERQVQEKVIGDIATVPGGWDYAKRINNWMRRMAGGVEVEEAALPAVEAEQKQATRELEQVSMPGRAANDNAEMAANDNHIPGRGGFAANDNGVAVANDNHMPMMAANDNAVGVANDNDILVPTEKAPKWYNASKSFESWARGRPLIVDALGGLPQDVRTEVLALYDGEMRQAMEAAEQFDESLTGAAGRFKAAELGGRVSHELSEMLANRGNVRRGGPVWGALEPAVAYASAGHPVSGIGYGLGRAAYRMAEETVAPKVAEALWKMAATGSAGESVMRLKEYVSKAIDGYLKARSMGTTGVLKGASKFTGPKRTRKSYERELDGAYNFMASTADERFQNYLRHTQSLALAQEMVRKTDNHIGILQQTIPAKKGKNGKDAGRLLPVVVPKLLDQTEHMFMNKHSVLKSPFAALDHLRAGKLSKDQVAMLKDAWPEVHNLLVKEAQDQIMALKDSGKPMPVEKVTQLSILLDTPLDVIVQPDFIQPVQMALNSPQPQAQQQAQPPQAPAPVDQYMTVAEKVSM